MADADVLLEESRRCAQLAIGVLRIYVPIADFLYVRTAIVRQEPLLRAWKQL